MSASAETDVRGTAGHRPNPLMEAVEAPPIPAAQAWLAAYDGKAGPLLNLSQAAPGDPPPAELLARLAEAAGAPETTRYGPIPGEPDLRAALASEMTALYGGPVDAGDVVITSGCNQAFFAAALTVARAGDEVILPAPWYFNHKMILDMLGIVARPFALKAEDGFEPDPAAARALIGPRTRAIVLVSPNNPTGATCRPETIAAFADLAEAAGLFLILDETYRDFLPEGRDRPHDLFAAGRSRASLIHLYSFSKAYSIPGHRLGALVAAPALVDQVIKVQDCLQICAPRAGQAAIAWAIPALGDWRAANRRMINRRAALFADRLATVPGWRVEAAGAYFAYVRHPGRQPALAVAERLCRERGVLTLPGSWFGPGQEGHLRIAFANVDDAALDRIAERFLELD